MFFAMPLIAVVVIIVVVKRPVGHEETIVCNWFALSVALYIRRENDDKNRLATGVLGQNETYKQAEWWSKRHVTAGFSLPSARIVFQ